MYLRFQLVYIAELLLRAQARVKLDTHLAAIQVTLKVKDMRLRRYVTWA